MIDTEHHRNYWHSPSDPILVSGVLVYQNTTPTGSRAMKILENLQKAHDLLDNCNAENDSGGCLFCNSYGYSQFGLIHHENCLILKLRGLIEVEKAVLGVENTV